MNQILAYLIVCDVNKYMKCLSSTYIMFHSHNYVQWFLRYAGLHWCDGNTLRAIALSILQIVKLKMTSSKTTYRSHMCIGIYSLPNVLGSRFSIEGLLIPMGSKSAEWCPRNYRDRNIQQEKIICLFV